MRLNLETINQVEGLLNKINSNRFIFETSQRKLCIDQEPSIVSNWKNFLNKLYFVEMSEMFFQENNGLGKKPLFFDEFPSVISSFNYIAEKYKDCPLLLDSIGYLNKMHVFYYGKEDERTKKFLEKYMVKNFGD